MINILKLFVAPITGIIQKRQDRKIAKDQIKGKLAMAKQAGSQEVTFNDQELEQLFTTQKENSWTDEYVTVSFVSLVNTVAIGGIMAAFGKPEVLEGMGLAFTAMNNAGVEIGFVITAVALSAVGLNVWRKM